MKFFVSLAAILLAVALAASTSAGEKEEVHRLWKYFAGSSWSGANGGAMKFEEAGRDRFLLQAADTVAILWWDLETENWKQFSVTDTGRFTVTFGYEDKHVVANSETHDFTKNEGSTAKWKFTILDENSVKMEFTNITENGQKAPDRSIVLKRKERPTE